MPNLLKDYPQLKIREWIAQPIFDKPISQSVMNSELNPHMMHFFVLKINWPCTMDNVRSKKVLRYFYGCNYLRRFIFFQWALTPFHYFDLQLLEVHVRSPTSILTWVYKQITSNSHVIHKFAFNWLLFFKVYTKEMHTENDEISLCINGYYSKFHGNVSWPTIKEFTLLPQLMIWWCRTHTVSL